jgi:hypothetical protein
LPRKTVAIRGLDTDLYHEVFSMAKKDGKRVSEVVNYALKEFLNGGYENNHVNNVKLNNNSKFFILKNDGDISLSKTDIISLKKEVGSFVIETSGRLLFEKDVDKASLDNVDKIIVHDGTVEVPRNLFPHVLIRSEIYGKIEKY